VSSSQDDIFPVVIIGSGIAGLRLALSLADHARVRVVTKGRDYESNTNNAQGGIAAVLAADDDLESHVADTLRAGAGLCHEEIVRGMVEAGPRLIDDLVQLGIQFTRENAGGYALGREGGHTHRRVIHAGDFTGRELERCLVRAARSHASIQLLEDHFAIDLIKSDEGRASGALVLDRRRHEVEAHPATFTVIASGGTGKVYRYTSNPDVATGDGMAMAYRAGATLANLEFEQFHPTCLFHPDAKSFLISEAVRGEGAVLRNLDGEAFMTRYHELADLAPRDIVARAIDQEMKERGDDHVLLDTTMIPTEKAAQRFPNIRARCIEFGFDLTRQPLPVVPAAHYACGGIWTDRHGASDLPGLYAIGEAGMTGAHGANRLASNSLLEALYYAWQAGIDLETHIREQDPVDPTKLVLPDVGAARSTPTPLQHDWEVARQTMWNYVGIQRDLERLQVARQRMRNLAEQADAWMRKQRPTVDLGELRNVTCLGELVVRSAAFRLESRGLHSLREYPHRDDQHFLGDSHIALDREPWLRPLKEVAHGSTGERL